MRLLICGATPLGAYLAAHFRFLNQQAVWLVDAQTADAVTRAGGIEVRSPSVHRRATDVRVTTSPDEAFATEYDAIFFIMQAYQTASALSQMRRHLKAAPPIVALQRGVGGAEQIESAYGVGSVIRGALSAVISSPIVNKQWALENVVQMGLGGVGLADDHPFSREIAALLWAAYLPVMLDDGRDLQWSALLWQLQANAVPALVDLSADDVYSSPSLFAIEHRQLLEALGIVQALKVRLIDLPDAPINLLTTQLQTLPAALLPSRMVRTPAPPSLRVELEFGAANSEAAYLNGAIAIQANDLKLRAPINHALALALQDIAERRALWSQFQRSPRMLEALIGAAGG